MECPHLLENVKISSPAQTATKELACAVCSATDSPWMCLHCGVLHCGRYVNGHSLEHSKQQNHLVCIDCSSLSVFCYSCDDFVVNDTENGCLARIRQLIKVGETSQGSTAHENRRNLRPRSRKRCHSADSSTGSTENGSVENEKAYPRKRRTTSNTYLKTVKREKKVVGLRNLGNTCFMNAVLQSLSNIEEFRVYFKKLPSLDNIKGVGRSKVYQSRSFRELNDAIMAEELRKIIISLTDNGASKSAISPESLFLVIWKVVPRFRGYQQQDAHEFLRYMLDRLHTELLHLLPESPYLLGHKGKSSIVTSVFGGTLQSEVTCLNCNVESKKHDPFLDLSLDIPEKCYQKKNRDSSDEPISPCNILDCLTSFIQVEELAETELYYCNNCKSKQRSTKRFWIRRLPNVLCLHLKRFRWNNFWRTKIDINIQFPVSALDMSQFVLSDLPDTRLSGSNLYDLAAVVVHHGSGAGSGHYTAFAINDGQWWHFNDSSVRQTQLEVVAKCKPYILFYIKREFSVHSS
ncbi:ubiquitin carboxyl-terminal hydrolase 3-like [Macrosteles quadrilineatus]|uniref:ubiquitin carboxyl-terminal hydrolase 3-like n=1 Tax=Macrosteles quadrilineatus TaxID=74068 RepID=UPI0023E0FFC3|nr:ubiquitin carboxyl-terminal hydrolase 3-like [Macrosteles quadrilineatus]XP_054288121.1 ubiquitin carboxyl-terminal hydrolase 3-like [Macrosteles quadrilineatus]